MRVMLIGEMHKQGEWSRKAALTLIKKIIAKNKTVRFMIEFESNDYQVFLKDIREKKLSENQLFIPIAEIIKIASVDIIDIPLLLLLQGIQQKLKADKPTTQDHLLNKVLDERWNHTTHPVGVAVNNIFVYTSENDYDPFPEKLNELGYQQLFELVSKFKLGLKKLIDELYRKTSMKKFRDQYFLEKINKEINKNRADFLVILVGNDHHSPLQEGLKEKLGEEKVINATITTKENATEFLKEADNFLKQSIHQLPQNSLLFNNQQSSSNDNNNNNNNTNQNETNDNQSNNNNNGL